MWLLATLLAGGCLLLARAAKEPLIRNNIDHSIDSRHAGSPVGWTTLAGWRLAPS